MPSTIPEFELREIAMAPSHGWWMGWWLWRIFGVSFSRKIWDVNEVKAHEELFVVCKTVKSSAVSSKMWCFLFTLISVDRIPATEVGLFSRVRMPWRMEKDAFFFDVHVSKGQKTLWKASITIRHHYIILFRKGQKRIWKSCWDLLMSECDTGAVAVGWSSSVVARWPVVKYIWDSYIKQYWYIGVMLIYKVCKKLIHNASWACMMVMMLMMMVMVMMLIQIVTVLRYVEKASLCGHGRCLQSHCPGVELQHGACQNFVSLETYTWDHTFSCPRSDARSDTPRYPERYLKSMKLGSTPHGHLKLYNLCYRWKNMGSMNKGTLKFLLG